MLKSFLYRQSIRDLLELLDFEKAAKHGNTKIGHQGTYNANPLTAAAGVAALTLIAETDVCDRATCVAGALRELLRSSKLAKWT